jgi:hypothetical protein
VQRQPCARRLIKCLLAVELGCTTPLGSLTAELTRCPSSQLQTVGELCVGGTCDVHAMGGTICYAVDDVRAAAAHEGGTDVRVLTVVTSVDGMKVVPAQHQGRLSSVGGSAGSASSGPSGATA